MTEYIINYDCERESILDVLKKTFVKYNDFQRCGVKKICLPKGFLLLTQHLLSYPTEIDEKLHRGQVAIIMETFPEKKKTEQPQNNADIVYVVRVKPEFQINFNNTTINHKFTGKILAQIRDAYVFELNGSYGVTVIIPFDWIECMAPSKAHWEEKYGKA